MADDDGRFLMKAPGNAEPEEKEEEGEKTEHTVPSERVQVQAGSAPEDHAGREDGQPVGEPSTPPTAIYDKAVGDTQQELATEHSDVVIEGKLGVAAVDRLRQRSAAEGAERREVVVQMETFHRSSTRRESFMLAMKHGAEEGEEGEVFLRDDGTSAGITDKGDRPTSEASFCPGT